MEKGLVAQLKVEILKLKGFFLSLYLTEKDQMVNGTEVLIKILKWQK